MKDKEVQKLDNKEAKRQHSVTNLIASENYVSDDVRKAQSSVFTNKYAEGYPGRRYYGGQENTDPLELLTEKRALTLFVKGSPEWHVNVQALSGSPANLAVCMALVPIVVSPPRNEVDLKDSEWNMLESKRGRIMGMSLPHGGHLTHGHSVSMTGKLWKQIPYGVDKATEQLDYEELKRIAQREKPHLVIAGFTAYSRIVDFKKFKEIADSCGALLMVDMSHFAGLVAGGVYPSPFPYADIVTTTTHKTLRGPRHALIFSKGDELAQKIDKMIFPGLQGGPHMNTIAAVAVALKEANTPAFKKYAQQVVKNAKVLAEELEKRGWRIISGGTDSHLLLVDTWMNGKGISGKEASERLEKAGIIVNMNTIPFDTRKPMDPSGIRLGTPAETTHGKKEKDMVKIAERIDKILKEC
ncbi:MAG: serine hydroxymethyltransferase [Parcubacteria group bacterium]|nr:serine hydroxymethyltransferase [Parcubacteria group bacterium]